MAIANLVSLLLTFRRDRATIALEVFMHFDFGTILIATLLISAVVLVINTNERLFPLMALIAAGLEALIAFHIINLSSEKFRIDVILPAVLLIAGGVSWARSSVKPTITAATIVALLGAMQLLLALHL